MTLFTLFFSLFWLQILNLPASLQNKNTRIGPFPWKLSVLKNPDRERTNQSTGICLRLALPYNNNNYFYYYSYLSLKQQICLTSSCAISNFGLPTPLIAAERGPKSAILVVLLPISAILFHRYNWISEKHEQSSWS